MFFTVRISIANLSYHFCQQFIGALQFNASSIIPAIHSLRQFLISNIVLGCCKVVFICDTPFILDHFMLKRKGKGLNFYC